MSGLLLLIFIVIGIPLLWKWLKPYFYRWMQRRATDYLFRSMGVPPHDRKGGDTSGDERQSRYSTDPYGQRARRRGYSQGPLIPKEYAVDVEYTEIHSYSREEKIASDGERVSYKIESQVSDAEIIEIRRDR